MPATLVQWDTQLFFHINNSWAAPWLDLVMPVFSSTMLLWIVALLVVGCWIVRVLRQRDAAQLRRVLLSMLLLGLCLVVTNTTTDLVKKQAGRIRPYNALPLARYVDNGLWQQRPENFIPHSKAGSSFFSGHAANTMALAVGISTLYPPAAPLVYLLPFSVGYSRVYLGKHYPGDVAAGWLAGWCLATMVCRIAKRKKPFAALFGKNA